MIRTAEIRFSTRVAETAIGSFEAIHGLTVTVHDLRGSLWPFLRLDRFRHNHPLCQAVKASPFDQVCVQWEVGRLRQELPQLPDGRIQVCHAGLVEWVVPYFEELKLAWVIFAGVRRPGSNMAASCDARSRWNNWPRNVKLPPAVSRDEAEQILEHLRQLRARLVEIVHAQHLSGMDHLANHAFPSDQLTQRRTIIYRFIAMHHPRHVYLADLARELNLSEDRASHLVYEVTGATFRDLLTEARLRTAAGLLQNSDLSVLKVALASGFTEISHFTRMFRRYTGLPPARFRREEQGRSTQTFPKSIE